MFLKLFLKVTLCFLKTKISHHVPNVNSTQENAKSTAALSKSLESTRAHLQGQLRSKEAENNRLAVQIKVGRIVTFPPVFNQLYPSAACNSVPVWSNLPTAPEPGASDQPAEGRDGASAGAAGETEAAGQRRQGVSETSHASPEAASCAQRGRRRPAERPAAGHGRAVELLD